MRAKRILVVFALSLFAYAASPNLVALKEWTWAPGINFTKQQVLVFEGDWISIHLVCEPVKPDMCSGAASYAYSGQLPTEFPILAVPLHWVGWKHSCWDGPCGSDDWNHHGVGCRGFQGSDLPLDARGYAMSDGDNLVDLTNTTIVRYKARDGMDKELRVIQPMDPDQRKLEFKDIQLLAKEIAKVLKEDAA